MEASSRIEELEEIVKQLISKEQENEKIILQQEQLINQLLINNEEIKNNNERSKWNKINVNKSHYDKYTIEKFVSFELTYKEIPSRSIILGNIPTGTTEEDLDYLVKLFGDYQEMDIKDLKNATAEQLLELENVGEITADAIISWFKDEKNVEEIAALFAAGVQPQIKQKAVVSGIFAGQFVVLTGTLQDFKRSEAQKIIEENGGECQSSVTSKTTLVIAGESAGSKLDKAKKLGVKIIDEAQFKEML